MAGPGHLTVPAAALADQLPSWVALVRAPNPGPMTLDGTNTWLLRRPGASACLVVDPGPEDDGHLRAVVDRGPVAGYLVTHGHPDHVAGAAAFEQLSGALRVEMPVERPTELAGLTVTAIATPGHTADSLCYLVEADGQRAVLTGDTILGRGTTVVAWPDGELGQYLASLRRLTAYRGVPVLPGHGPALADCGAAADFYLTHRLARLDQVRAALAAGAVTAEDVVARVYADVDRALWPAATWSVRAQLAYLESEGSAL